MSDVWQKIKEWFGFGVKEGIKYIKEHPKVIEKTIEKSKEIVNK